MLLRYIIFILTAVALASCGHTTESFLSDNYPKTSEETRQLRCIKNVVNPSKLAVVGRPDKMRKRFEFIPNYKDFEENARGYRKN